MWQYCCSSLTPHPSSSRTHGRSGRHATRLLSGAAGRTPDLEDTGHTVQRPDLEPATISLEDKPYRPRTRELSGCAALADRFVIAALDGAKSRWGPQRNGDRPVSTYLLQRLGPVGSVVVERGGGICVGRAESEP